VQQSRKTFLSTVAGGVLASTMAVAQEPAASVYVPKQSDRPQALAGEEPGFQPIFDGKSLNGWEGDSRYWRVENECLVGEVTPETLLKSNTFIVWRGGSPGDFELKAEYRITPHGNSGINYRSAMVADKMTPSNRFAMRGYQADIDGQNQYTGQNYEEKGRLFLAVRGQVTRVTGGRPPVILASIGDAKELASKISTDWNSYHLIIQGTELIHMLNGQLMCVVIDDDTANRSSSGLIGVQVHVGPPMKVEYRNFRLKTL
jgi:hypothetical protein